MVKAFFEVFLSTEQKKSAKNMTSSRGYAKVSVSIRIIQAGDTGVEKFGEALHLPQKAPSNGAIVVMATNLDQDKWRVLAKE